MYLTKPATLVIAILSASLVGCFDSNPPGDPPVDRSTQLADLSDDDYSALCEWAAEIDGFPDQPVTECDGFGRPTMNPVRCVRTRQDRSTFPDCRATVADYEACIRHIAVDRCDIEGPECRGGSQWEGCQFPI